MHWKSWIISCVDIMNEYSVISVKLWTTRVLYFTGSKITAHSGSNVCVLPYCKNIKTGQNWTLGKGDNTVPAFFVKSDKFRFYPRYQATVGWTISDWIIVWFNNIHGLLHCCLSSTRRCIRWLSSRSTSYQVCWILLHDSNKFIPIYEYWYNN